MHFLVLAIHIFCALGLIVTVLLQAGKGSGLASTFGASTMESTFGTGASDVLKKATTTMAIIFMLTSLTLAFMSARRSSTLMKSLKELESERTQVEQTQPAKTAPVKQSSDENQQSPIKTTTQVNIDPNSGQKTIIKETTQTINTVEEKTSPEALEGVSDVISQIQKIKTNADNQPNMEETTDQSPN